MKMNERDIAAYKIAMALKTIQTFRKNEEFFTNIVSTISQFTDDQMPLKTKWEVIKATLGPLHISIRKPTERTEDYDDLDGMEIMKRSEFRSCFDALCLKPHCTECGLCGGRTGDNHLCRCAICDLEFTSSSDGATHNSGTDCKSS